MDYWIQLSRQLIEAVAAQVLNEENLPAPLRDFIDTYLRFYVDSEDQFRQFVQWYIERATEQFRQYLIQYTGAAAISTPSKKKTPKATSQDKSPANMVGPFV